MILFPTIAITDPSSWELADAAAARLGSYAWVVFTSQNAVEGLLRRLQDRGGIEGLAGARIAAVGSATRKALAEADLEVHLVPEEFTSASLVEAMGAGDGRVLVPRAEEVPPGLGEGLASAGWSVDAAPVYRTITAPATPADVVALWSDGFEAVTFTSGSTVRGFCEICERAADSLPPGGLAPAVACIGPETAEVAASLGLRVDVIASPHTSQGLAVGLARHFAGGVVSLPNSGTIDR